LFAALVRWIDKDIDRYMSNQAVALIVAAGVVPGALAGWNWFTIAIGVAWGVAWIGLWLWRMADWLEKETAKKRRRIRRKVLRDARATSVEQEAKN
jgi:hypothetical protein